MNAIELSLFVSRIESICAEMGAVLQKTAFSPNIKDRLDFSCAIFSKTGQLCAQAAHIPVHLGSMAYAMADIVREQDWLDGDCLILNDPYLGGTHLPDVTLISPVFIKETLIAFVANRAHHADIGAETPGSMPLATSLAEEGLIIPPSFIMRQGKICDENMQSLLKQINNPVAGKADLSAQISANLKGRERLLELIQSLQHEYFSAALNELNDYGERLAKSTLNSIPDGVYSFTDYMDDDGQGQSNIPIQVSVQVKQQTVLVDFTGTAKQVKGNINCPLSVAAAAVYYCFYALMPPGTPACSGSFRPIKIEASNNSLINASSPAAVAAGNVETSTRIVDVVLGALAQALPNQIPAASHGSMNNVAMGSQHDKKNIWDYYETLGGGMGASSHGDGQSAVQTHMTNTYNTPIEVLEMVYPLRIRKYAIRHASGGQGKFNGGDGLIREFEFLKDNTSISLLTERRSHAPWGLESGAEGKPGLNSFNSEPIPAKVTLKAQHGDRLTIETPGGGGWGK